MLTALTALGAALLGGVLALLSTRHNTASQHHAWLKNQRLESATELLAASDQLLSRLIDTPNPTERYELCRSGTDGLIDLPARSRLILVGDHRTENVIRELIRQLGKGEAANDESASYAAVRTAFIRHVRKLIHS